MMWLIYLGTFLGVITSAVSTETCYEGITIWLTSFNESSTFLETPGYPIDYPSNFQCGVVMEAENSGDIVKLQSWNTSLNTPPGGSCTLDYAEIFDGLDPSYPLLSRWCGETRPVVATSGRYAYFRLVTDNNSTGDGFGIKLEFTSGTLGIVPVVTTTQMTTTMIITTTAAAPPVGGIVGGVIGGLFGIAGLVCLIIFCIKKYKKTKVDSDKTQLKQTHEKSDMRVTEVCDDDKVSRVGSSRPMSRRQPSRMTRGSGRMTSESFSDSPRVLTPAFSPTPPRTPKGSLRFIESRLRLNTEMGSPATPPPSHREALRSSAITIASIHSGVSQTAKNGLIDDMGIPSTPVIQEHPEQV